MQKSQVKIQKKRKNSSGHQNPLELTAVLVSVFEEPLNCQNFY